MKSSWVRRDIDQIPTKFGVFNQSYHLYQVNWISGIIFLVRRLICSNKCWVTRKWMSHKLRYTMKARIYSITTRRFFGKCHMAKYASCEIHVLPYEELGWEIKFHKLAELGNWTTNSRNEGLWYFSLTFLPFHFHCSVISISGIGTAIVVPILKVADKWPHWQINFQILSPVIQNDEKYESQIDLFGSPVKLV